MGGMDNSRLPFLQEYQLSEARFYSLLLGGDSEGLLDQEWAVRKLIGQSPYSEIMRLLDLQTLVRNWPRWRSWIASVDRRRGMDFLVAYLQFTYPETFGRPVNGSSRS